MASWSTITMFPTHTVMWSHCQSGNLRQILTCRYSIDWILYRNFHKLGHHVGLFARFLHFLPQVAHFFVKAEIMDPCVNHTQEVSLFRRIQTELELLSISTALFRVSVMVLFSFRNKKFISGSLKPCRNRSHMSSSKWSPSYFAKTNI